MVEVLKTVPALLIVVGPPFLAGSVGRVVLGLVWPAMFAVLAITATANEPANYDMPGFGLWLFSLCAGLAFLGLLAGAGLRQLRRRASASRSGRTRP